MGCVHILFEHIHSLCANQQCSALPSFPSRRFYALPSTGMHTFLASSTSNDLHASLHTECEMLVSSAGTNGAFQRHVQCTGNSGGVCCAGYFCHMLPRSCSLLLEIHVAVTCAPFVLTCILTCILGSCEDMLSSPEIFYFPQVVPKLRCHDTVRFTQ